MNETRKLQMLILMIAKDIAAICDKYKINYIIDAGTLLGAIRHKGFIPWDDDFDIGMLRSDYERFIGICKKELDPDKYFIQTEDTELNYCFEFAKIQLKNTEITEDFSKNVNIHHGIFVDIFPYDNLPNGKIRRKIHMIKNHFYKNMIWIKFGYGSNRHKKKLYYKVFKLLGNLYSIESLKSKRKKLLLKYAKESSCNVFTSDYPKSLLKKAWFDETVPYNFEDTSFKGFKSYDAFLSLRYGDYMTLPPENKRKTHSKYKIDFGIYN